MPCFQEIVCQDCGSINNGQAQERCGSHIGVAGKKFPPSFFDIMTHLLIHLMDELTICDLVHTQWMYPIECYLKTLKGYVQNKTSLKGSMESLGFCTKYLQDFTAMKQRVWDEKKDPSMYDEVLKRSG